MSGIISVSTHAPSWRLRALRWLPTFVGFPLGAVAARWLVGPIASLPAALLCGLDTVLPWKAVPAGPMAWRWLKLGLPGAATLGLKARRPKPGLGGVLVPTVLWRA